jgi:hypothetical protein
MKLNLGTNVEPQMVKINAQLLKEFRDVFAWTYKDLKGIPPKLAHHKLNWILLYHWHIRPCIN